jgi:hypothetical protein
MTSQWRGLGIERTGCMNSQSAAGPGRQLRASCYAGRMSLVATLAMLIADASRSGIHTGGEECDAQCPPGHMVNGGYCTPMFRRAPGLSGTPFPGNGISIPETKAPKLPR